MNATSNIETLVLIGPHSAGKTTLGRHIASALSWRFDEELGEQLRRRALARDAGAHAALAQPEFDRRVLQAELARDAHRAANRPRVIETWHLGNLAYARRRSPEVAAALGSRIEAAIRRTAKRGLLVQPLRIDEKSLRQRQTEPGPESLAGFFLQVAEEAERLAEELGLWVVPPLWTDQLSPEAALATMCSLPGLRRPLAGQTP